MNDRYFERLTVKKTVKRNVLLLLAIWFSAAALAAAALVFLRLPLNFVMIAAVLYGGVTMTKKLSVEYEYLFTNGELDLDLIIGRSDRKRLANLTCKQIVSLKPYTGQAPDDCVKVWDCVNPGEGTPYLLVFQQDGEGKKAMILDLPREYVEIMKPYLNAQVAREALQE